MIGLALVVGLVACGSGPPSQFGDSAPFGSNDDQCASANLRNEADDQQVLDVAIECLRAEYEAGRPVTLDVDIPTVEGDPIFWRYHITEEFILIVDDSRSDEYGQGTIRARTCETLEFVDRMPEGVDCERVNHPGFPEAER